MEQLEKSQDQLEDSVHLEDRRSEVDKRNKLESVERLQEYYSSEIVRRDQVIEQQRFVIKSLSQKYTNEIRSPFESN